VERDPLHKTNEVGEIEFGSEILLVEKELFLALRKKFDRKLLK
jgi:hypothetical protein